MTSEKKKWKKWKWKKKKECFIFALCDVLVFASSVTMIVSIRTQYFSLFFLRAAHILKWKAWKIAYTNTGNLCECGKLASMPSPSSSSACFNVLVARVHVLWSRGFLFWKRKKRSGIFYDFSFGSTWITAFAFCFQSTSK